jgi:hypothetical protein
VCVCVCLPLALHAQGDATALDLMVQCGGLSSLENLVTYYGDEWTPFLAPTMAAMGSYQVPLPHALYRQRAAWDSRAVQRPKANRRP